MPSIAALKIIFPFFALIFALPHPVPPHLHAGKLLSRGMMEEGKPGSCVQAAVSKLLRDSIQAAVQNAPGSGNQAAVHEERPDSTCPPAQGTLMERRRVLLKDRNWNHCSGMIMFQRLLA